MADCGNNSAFSADLTELTTLAVRKQTSESKLFTITQFWFTLWQPTSQFEVVPASSYIGKLNTGMRNSIFSVMI